MLCNHMFYVDVRIMYAAVRTQPFRRVYRRDLLWLCVDMADVDLDLDHV